MSTPDQDILRQSLRTMAILVGACVLFVGALSTAAVVITGKAVSGEPSAAPAAAELAPKDSAAKKPLSI